MVKCKFCGEKLADKNWYPSRKKKHDYICNSCSKKKQHTYYTENKQKIIENVNNWTITNHQRKITAMQSWRMKLKLDAIKHYSDGTLKCIRCGYSDIRALSIDHINGCGKQKRKEHGHSFYKWLKDNNYPKGYQTLCMNCQFIKRVENKEFSKGKNT